MLGSGDFLKIVIIGEDEATIGFGEGKEAVIDKRIIKLVWQDSGIEINNSFELADEVKTSTSTGALFGIFAIGEKLKFVSNATRNDDVVADKAGLRDGEKARIHQG